MKEKEMIDVKEVSRMTGLCISSIYTKISRLELPFIKFGRAVRFYREDIKKWIEQQREKTEKLKAAMQKKLDEKKEQEEKKRQSKSCSKKKKRNG